MFKKSLYFIKKLVKLEIIIINAKKRNKEFREQKIYVVTI